MYNYKGGVLGIRLILAGREGFHVVEHNRALECFSERVYIPLSGTFLFFLIW